MTKVTSIKEKVIKTYCISTRKHVCRSYVEQLFSLVEHLQTFPGRLNMLFRVPTEIQKHNSMIFPWFSMINKCNFNDFNAQSQTSPFSRMVTTLSINVECSNSNVFKYYKHACRPCMHFEIIKLETTRSQKTSCQTHKFCVSDS